MDRVFSVDEMSDQFWSPPPHPHPQPPQAPSSSAHSPPQTADESSKMMNRSASEWAFQRFLQLEVEPSETETTTASSSAPLNDVVLLDTKTATDNNNNSHSHSHSHSNNNNNNNTKSNGNGNNAASTTSFTSKNKSNNGTTSTTPSFNAGPPPNIPIDSEEYQAFLKSKLNLACAAVALSRVCFFLILLFLFFLLVFFWNIVHGFCLVAKKVEEMNSLDLGFFSPFALSGYLGLLLLFGYWESFRKEKKVYISMNFLVFYWFSGEWKKKKVVFLFKFLLASHVVRNLGFGRLIFFPPSIFL